jgi:hypothetical protein
VIVLVAALYVARPVLKMVDGLLREGLAIVDVAFLTP